MAGVKFSWNDDPIRKQAEAKIERGLTSAAADGAAETQKPFPVGAPRNTGNLANNMTFERAHKEGDRWVAAFGNWVVAYTLWQELKHNFIRRAADKVSPTIGDRINRA